MVKKSRGGQTLNSSAENQKNSPQKLKKKRLGSILIEVAFTLPIVVYLMFFCIELIKINITQEALQSICEEATYLTIAHDFNSYSDLTDKIDKIIEKYRPSFIPYESPQYTSTPYPVIRYWIQIYTNLSEMLSAAPYGGMCVAYPPYETNEPARLHYSFGGIGAEIIPVNNMEYNGISGQWGKGKDWAEGRLNINNYVFVITFSCNYPFSSSMVRMLFGGGINTKIAKNYSGYNDVAKGNKGTMYLLWARGSGIINP